MMLQRTLHSAFGFRLVMMSAACVLFGSGADWPQFRGSSLGVATEAHPPVTWDIPAGKNVAWQAELPGRGPSSPIVVGGRVVVTASSGVKQDQLHVLCFDAASGRLLWHRQFWATGRTACHPVSANAAPTPASDGKRIFAFYSSNDLICLDLDGNLLWYRGLAYDYPHAGNDVGMSSSPVVIAGVVVVQVENQGDSFAAGIDAETGQTVWHIERERAATWTSPVAWSGGPEDKPIVLLQSASAITAHDARTGRELWRLDRACDLIPSPILNGERAFFVASDRFIALKRLGDHEVKVLWESPRLRPGAASPVVAGRRLFIVNRAGVLACADTETGDVAWQLRLKGEFWATPFVAGDLVYLFSQDGDAQVVRAGKTEGELIASNPVGEKVQGSPAVSENSIYIRSDQHLWRITSEE